MKPPLRKSPLRRHPAQSDAGGVRLGLTDTASVKAALMEMAALPAITNAEVDGYLIEEMAPPERKWSSADCATHNSER